MSVLGILIAALGTAWSVLATDVIVESGRAADGTFYLFGRAMTSVALSVEMLILAAMAASVGTIIALAISAGRRASRWRQLRVQVDGHYEEMSTKIAGMEARNELLEWRIPELQAQVAGLLEKRDELLDEMGRIAERARVLGELASQRQEDLSDDNVVVLADAEREADTPSQPREAATTPPRSSTK